MQSPAGEAWNVLVYNYDGDVYASDESRMLAEMKDWTFRLGNVHTDTRRTIFTGDRVCQDFCVNGLVLFLGMGSGEGGNSPSPARRYRSRRFHCVILSSAGIRSGHRIMKWFNASRQR
jgi:hypothetical protein